MIRDEDDEEDDGTDDDSEYNDDDEDEYDDQARRRVAGDSDREQKSILPFPHQYHILFSAEILFVFFADIQVLMRISLFSPFFFANKNRNRRKDRGSHDQAPSATARQ